MGQVLLNTHHFIARYFLQTGWLRSSMRLYCTIACRRCNRIMTHSQYTQHILHKQWYSLQNQRGCTGNSPALLFRFRAETVRNLTLDPDCSLLTASY